MRSAFPEGRASTKFRETFLRFLIVSKFHGKEKEEYLEFVATKIRKYTASKKALIHRALLDDVFVRSARDSSIC